MKVLADHEMRGLPEVKFRKKPKNQAGGASSAPFLLAPIIDCLKIYSRKNNECCGNELRTLHW